MTASPNVISVAMLTLQNLEKLHGDTKIAAVQTFWSAMPLSNAHKVEMLPLG